MTNCCVKNEKETEVMTLREKKKKLKIKAQQRALVHKKEAPTNLVSQRFSTLFSLPRSQKSTHSTSGTVGTLIKSVVCMHVYICI